MIYETDCRQAGCRAGGRVDAPDSYKGDGIARVIST